MQGHSVLFDSGGFTFRDQVEVAYYFLWRQCIATQDPISMDTQARPCGRVAIRRTGERPVEYIDQRTGWKVHATEEHSWWETVPAPHFTTKPGDWLADTIPEMPSLRTP